IVTGWQTGLKHFDEAIEQADPEHKEILETDRGLAEAAGIHFASVANQARFVMARDALRANPDDTQAAEQYQAAAQRESEAANRLLDLMQADSRIGFEASNGYYYTPLDLVEKVINCHWA